MNIPVLSDAQLTDLTTFISIARKYNMFGGEGPDRPFWINFRAHMKTGEFSDLFTAFCASKRIDITSVPYQHRAKVFDHYLNMAKG